jgi:hypothetical protein
MWGTKNLLLENIFVKNLLIIDSWKLLELRQFTPLKFPRSLVQLTFYLLIKLVHICASLGRHRGIVGF